MDSVSAARDCGGQVSNPTHTPLPSKSAFEWRDLLSWTPSPTSLGDSRAFLQKRVELYLGFLLALFGTFYVVDGTVLVLEGGTVGLLQPGQLAHLGLVVLIGVLWLWTRVGQRNARALAVAEAVTTLSVAGVGVVVLQWIPRGEIPAGPMMGLTLMLVGRAAIVPSTGLRTLLVGALVTAILVPGYDSRGDDSDFAGFVLIWMSAFTLAAAFVSRVIYGLQEQVRQARQLGQYVLEERLGEGGMGVVYRASHRLLRRPTAVKLMSPERTGQKDSARFEQEVQQTARLSHPNTVTVYDYGRSAEGVFYYAMELLDGATLEAVVNASGALPPARVVRVLAAVAGALSEAHSNHLIHRDIKPANIMLCEQGGQVDVVKVLDFGLVKDISVNTELTQEGALTGTPAFMSPETIQNPAAIGPRSDLYALGGVGYFLLTGKHVFDGRTVVEVCSHHLISPPIPPSQRAPGGCPEGLERIILQCLEKAPERRPPSALALRRALLSLSDLGEWTDDDAREWWKQFRHKTEAEASTTPSPLSATLAVDLFQRS